MPQQLNEWDRAEVQSRPRKMVIAALMESIPMGLTLLVFFITKNRFYLNVGLGITVLGSLIFMAYVIGRLLRCPACRKTLPVMNPDRCPHCSVLYK